MQNLEKQQQISKGVKEELKQKKKAEGRKHSTIIINIAFEIQSQTGKVGLGWSLKKEDGGVILTGAEVPKAGQNTSVAELLPV